MAKATVAECDGFLCIRWESPDSFKPENIVNYWPVRQFNRHDHAELVGLEAYEDGPGQYAVRTSQGGYFVRLPLQDYGRTQSIKAEVIPIPCPKVRAGIETRWRYGRWEKRLATGWKPV